MIFVISNYDEFFFIKKKYPKALVFCENLVNYIRLKKFGCKYLFHKKIDFIDLAKKSKNWFTDDKNQDYFYFKDISLSQAITRKVIFDFKNNYRNYFAIKNLIKDENFFFISSNCSNSLKKISKNFFKEKQKMINFSIYNTKVLPASPDRANLEVPNNRKIYIFFRYLQSFIKRFFINKFIFIYEPINLKSIKKIKNILVSNSKNILNGCYFIDKPKKIIDIKNRDLEYRLRLFDKKKVFNQILKDKLFKFTVKDIIYRNKKNIENIINIYNDFLNFYEPKKIILNGETDIYSVILSYLCKIKKIETFLLLDGNHFYKDDFLFFKNIKSNKPIFDFYFAQGHLNKNLFLKQGIKEKQIFTIIPPIVENFGKKKHKTNQIYDAVIISYYVSLINLKFPWDKQLEIESDIIFCLDKLGYKSVAIKLKPGLEFNEQKIYRAEHIYKSIIDYKYNHEIKIKIFLNSGKFEDILKKSNLFIGPISSAIIEAKFFNKKYIVFSPKECGLPEIKMSNSTYFKKSDIAFNLDHLKKKLIKKKHSLNFKYNDLFPKTKIQDLKLWDE
jgi:hypothetical protein